ncbi:MAG: type II secretion system F family protein [Actinomycetota bacterium]|nr:type II secretion system F family protein [Actinomycetota bacterium]
MTTATYEYKARDAAGAVKTGRVQAETTGQAAGQLRAMGYTPVSISVRGQGLQREITLPSLRRVRLKDLAVFARQFATMINSGLSLLRALTILVDQTENPELRRVLGAVRNDIETGSALSTAMARHPDVFPPLMVNMTRAGEVGGFLDSVLIQVAENYEAEVRLRGKVKAAMTYPVVVLAIAVLAVVAMLLFIVPVFVGMFADFDSELPAPTRALVAISDLMRLLAPLGLVAGIAAAVTWRKVRRRAGVRAVVEPLLLRLPVFGQLFRKIALARFARNLGTMMSSGVPILQSLDIVAETTGNVVLERALRAVQDNVRRGEALAAPLHQHPVFPAMVVQMMAVGEDTGALDTMLHKIAEFYDQEVEATTEALTALIEPLMIVTIGSVIGAMIVALYMPIFKLMDVIN